MLSRYPKPEFLEKDLKYHRLNYLGLARLFTSNCLKARQYTVARTTQWRDCHYASVNADLSWFSMWSWSSSWWPHAWLTRANTVQPPLHSWRPTIKWWDIWAVGIECGIGRSRWANRQGSVEHGVVTRWTDLIRKSIWESAEFAGRHRLKRYPAGWNVIRSIVW
jgi:hypothetical protein